MRLATLPYRDSTSAVVVFDDATVAFVRELEGRENNVDANSLIITPLTDSEQYLLAQARTSSSGMKFLPPLLPPKNVFCVGKNYVAHAVEGARAEGSDVTDLPSSPIWFTKARTCLIGSGGEVKTREGFETHLDYEGELAVVIGRRCRNLTRENALQVVFGYTVFNDITARNIQQSRKQWFTGKSADTFGPIGPWIVTHEEIDDPQSLHVSTRVNDEIRQDGNTRDMIFPVSDLLVDLTKCITLEPGDIVSTGTPSGVAWGMEKPKYLRPGDRVSVEIEKIGCLESMIGTTTTPHIDT